MAVNERGAGRKKALSEEAIEELRKRYCNGETMNSLAGEAGISRQTLSSYFQDNYPQDGIYRTYTAWAKLNAVFREKEIANYSLRIEFMNKDKCLSVILVDFYSEQIRVINHTDNPILRPFGIKAKPTWEDFMYFLEERCIPKERFGIKQVLKDLGLEQYDVIRILEKTGGRTGEDDMWMKFSYYEKEKRYSEN
ncbi:MAG: Hin recombinase [Lachnospiraceae bacterium]|nr:Hin recombinase [Lachnospiraceae bacterium]